MTERERYCRMLKEVREYERRAAVFQRELRAGALAVMTSVTGGGTLLFGREHERLCPFCECAVLTAHLAPDRMPVNPREETVEYWRDQLRQHLAQLDDVFECFLCAATVTRRDLWPLVLETTEWLQQKIREALNRRRSQKAR